MKTHLVFSYVAIIVNTTKKTHRKFTFKNYCSEIETTFLLNDTQINQRSQRKPLDNNQSYFACIRMDAIDTCCILAETSDV